MEKIECGICGKKFNSQKDLSNHIVKDKHSGQTFPCSACDLTFSTKSNLKSHTDRVHKKITFGCASCGKYFNQAKTETIDIEMEDSLPACNITPKKQFSEVFDDFVLQSNDEIEEYPCDKSDKCFRKKNSLNVHNYRYHPEPEKLTCEL